MQTRHHERTAMIVVHHKAIFGKGSYEVIKLVNRLTPVIGTRLSHRQLEELMNIERNLLEVHIVG